MMTRRHLVNLLASSGLLAAAPISAQPEQGMAEVVQEVSTTAAAGDHSGKLAAYRKIAKLLAADPSNQNQLGLLIQADVQRDIARAVYDVGNADPCPSLDQGIAYLEQARAIIARDEEASETEVLDDMERQFTIDQRRMRCSQPGLPNEVGAPDASLIGHYYLSGVMETGSELLLKADGKFEWYISYGSVDQIAKGRWGRTGQAVTLVADVPSANAPLFRADEVFPWDDAAEGYRREYERAEQVELIAARCPWNAAVTPSLWSYNLENPKPADEVQLAKARETRGIAEAARDKASQIIAIAAAASANDDARAAANAAMDIFYAAQSEMAQAHHDANLPEPDIGSPAIPPECQLPADESYKQIPEAQWQPGIAVVVGDPVSEMRLSRVEVTFVFGDGHREMTKTRRGGFAFAPVRNGSAVEQIVLSLSEPVSRSATLTIKPLAQGIQTVIVDTQQIVEPAFSVMRLEVKGKALMPQDMPRGRYSRN